MCHIHLPMFFIVNNLAALFASIFRPILQREFLPCSCCRGRGRPRCISFAVKVFSCHCRRRRWRSFCPFHAWDWLGRQISANAQSSTWYSFGLHLISERGSHTLWGIQSVAMFCFVFFRKFRLEIGQHNSCSFSQTAGGTCQTITTEHTPHSVLAWRIYASKHELDFSRLSQFSHLMPQL